jgi:hypothetical protein
LAERCDLILIYARAGNFAGSDCDSGELVDCGQVMPAQVVCELGHCRRVEDRDHINVLTKQLLQPVDQDRAFD